MGLRARLIVSMASLVLATAAINGWLAHRGLDSAIVPEELRRMQAHCSLLGVHLDSYVRGAREDTMAMRDFPAIDGIVRARAAGGTDPVSGMTSSQWEELLSAVMLAQLKAKPAYLQIRLIGLDDTGREIVRVDRTKAGALPRVVPPAQLQRKGDRDYFQRAVRLPRDWVDVSDLQLNQELGVVQVPHVPVVRTAVPVFDSRGAVFGAFIINIDMTPALESLRHESSDTTRVHLVNAEGQYLLHPSGEGEFGFDLGNPFGWTDDWPGIAAGGVPSAASTKELAGQDGIEYGATVVPIRLAKGPSVVLFETARREDLAATAKPIQKSALISIAIVAFCAVIAALALASSLTRTLKQMTEAVADYKGEGDVFVPVRASGTVGVLARAFQHMAEEVSAKTAALKDEIEHRRRAQEEVQRQAGEKAALGEQLREAQKMEAVGRLAGGVAHDFNNLLTVIIGYSELAALKAGPGESGSCHQVIRAARRASDLTRQLLAFSRRQVISPRPLKINQSVAEMATMLKRLIGEDVEFATNLESGIWTVSADPGQVEQVVMNLCVNARDAMPRGGKLAIETHNVVLDEHYAGTRTDVVPGEYVMLAISDTGTGMDTATMEKIFEPFFTTKEVGKGTGLGLATVYGIMKQNRGHVAVYSEPGQGTTFKIYWPRTDAETAPTSISARSETSLRGTESILVVEDDEQVRLFASSVLTDHGYKVMQAADGAQALEMVREAKNSIDVLVSDVVMPRIGGRELADRMAKERPDLSILFVSGYTADAISSQGVLIEGMNFLSKPYTPDDLLRRVREVLAARKGR